MLTSLFKFIINQNISEPCCPQNRIRIDKHISASRQGYLKKIIVDLDHKDR